MSLFDSESDIGLESLDSNRILQKFLCPPEINQVIANRLYIGNSTGSDDKKLLEMNKITHILQVMNKDPTYPEDYNYRTIKVNDVESFNIRKKFDECYEYIEQILKESDESRLLVHCNMGVSRSSTIVIAYLMKKRKIGFREAYKHVLECRPSICPNKGFKIQLLMYEKELSNKS